MGEAKFTPGPWSIDTTVALGPYNILTQSDDVPQADCIVCSFDNWRRRPTKDGGDRARLEADARLIAAAPDLYAACQAIERLVAPEYREGGGMAVMEQVRSAIRKADGI